MLQSRREIKSLIGGVPDGLCDVIGEEVAEHASFLIHGVIIHRGLDEALLGLPPFPVAAVAFQL